MSARAARGRWLCAALAVALAWVLCGSVATAATAPRIDASPVPESPQLAPSLAAPAAPVRSEPAAEIATFAEVFRLIQDEYVDPIDDRRLMRAGIRALVGALDPYSGWLPRSELVEFGRQIEGDYAGFGIEAFYFSGRLTVIAPFDGSPAAQAGVEPGDVIVRIDGQVVPDDDREAALAMLRGPAGSSAEVQLAREGFETPIAVRLLREPVRVRSVRYELLEPGFGVLRIAEFRVNTTGEVRAAVRALAEASGGDLRGLVLDLRDNPGGAVDAAVAIADAFLDGGLIVRVVGRRAADEQRFEATPGDIAAGVSLVVLIDRGTASAAEILAAALKDQRRALLIGQRSFGKGSVQSVFDLASGDAIQLTTARYLRADGAPIQGRGVDPDLVLADRQLAPPDRPASLIDPDAAAIADAQPGGDDYALDQALTVLKTLALRPPG